MLVSIMNKGIKNNRKTYHNCNAQLQEKKKFIKKFTTNT